MPRARRGHEGNFGLDALYSDLKIVVIGDFAVGKTAIIRRYTEKKFPEETKSTVGATFLFKDWGNFCISIWDTAGRDKYTGISSFYFRHAGASILVYDMFAHYTLENLVERLIPVLDGAGRPELNVIVAAKCDLIGGDEEREVTREEGIELAKTMNPSIDFSEGQPIPYFEVSSKTGENIEEMFEYVFNYSFPDGKRRERPPTELTDSFRLDETPLRPRSGCCW